MVKVGTIITENGKQYELVPPEGGWGYLSCLALILFLMVALTYSSAFGIIYNGFLEERKEGTKGIAVVFGVSSITFALAGFGASILVKKFSLRQVGLMGAASYSTGMFLGIFVQSTTHMVFTTGILKSGGIGIMMPILFTSFNSYFTQKRMFLLSISKVIVGIAGIVAPMLIKISMEVYGFRGTLALLAAVSSHSIPAAILLQPVEWHLIRREITVVNKCAKDILRDDEEQVNKNQPLGEPRKPVTHDGDAPRRSSTPIARINSDDETYKKIDLGEEEKETLMRPASIIYNNEPLMKSKSGKWKAIVDFLDLSLLKDLVYVNIMLGESIILFSDMTYFTYIPLLLYKIHWSSSQVALSISLSAGADMLGRFSIAVFSRFKTVPSRTVFFVGVVLTFVNRIIFETSENGHVILALIVVLGYFRPFFHVMMPLVVAEHVPIKRYPAALGLKALVSGFMSLAAGTLIGVIRDYTQSYHVAFHILTGCLLLCLVPWSLEFYFTRRKSKHDEK